MADHSDEASCIQLTANIVSAYVSNNTVSSAEIPALIGQVYSALMRVSNGAAVAGPAEPLDYPMVAPNYAAARSQLAKQMGLGQQGRRRH